MLGQLKEKLIITEIVCAEECRLLFWPSIFILVVLRYQYKFITVNSFGNRCTVEKISDLSRESEKETEIIVCAKRKGFYDKLCRVRRKFLIPPINKLQALHL